MKTRCAARINVLDLNDNPAKIKIIEYLDETRGKDFYSFNTMAATSEVTSGEMAGVGFNKIRLYENNRPGIVLAIVKVFDSDELSNYKFSISSVVYGSEDISMFEIRMR